MVTYMVYTQKSLAFGVFVCGFCFRRQSRRMPEENIRSNPENSSRAPASLYAAHPMQLCSFILCNTLS